MPSHSHKLGPMPDPLITPGEPHPGGVDAIDGGDEDEEPAIPDLFPDSNPAMDDRAPEEIKQPDDTSTEATKNGDGPIKPEEESPA